MAPHTTQAQESRTERATLSLTPTEKRAVRAVAAVLGTDESNLLRDHTIPEVMEKFDSLRERTTDEED